MSMKTRKESFFYTPVNLKAIDRLKILLTTIEKIIWINLESISPGISNADPNNRKSIKVNSTQAQSLQQSMDPILKSINKQSQDNNSFTINADNITDIHERITDLSQQLTQKALTTSEAIAFVRERTAGAYYNRFAHHFFSYLYNHADTTSKKESENVKSENTVPPNDNLESLLDIRELEDFDPRKFNQPHYYIYYYPIQNNKCNPYNFKALGYLTLDFVSFVDFGIYGFIMQGIKNTIMNDLVYLNDYLILIRTAFDTYIRLSNKVRYQPELSLNDEFRDEINGSIRNLATPCYEFFEITKWKVENYNSYCLITDKKYTIKDYATRMGMLGFFGGSQLADQIKQEILSNNHIDCSTLPGDLVMYCEEKLQRHHRDHAITTGEIKIFLEPITANILTYSEYIVKENTETEDLNNQIAQLDRQIEYASENLSGMLSITEQEEQKLNKEKTESIELEHSLEKTLNF